MLQNLVDFVVPSCAFFLMLVAGTEVTKADFSNLNQNVRAIALGAFGPLLLLPPLVLALNALIMPPAPIAAGMLLLSLCPNGGISNYYCYLARCNVLLSACITATSTALCLFTIPLWLHVLPKLPYATTMLAAVPAGKILAQLASLVIAPMLIGMAIRQAFPTHVAKVGASLRSGSILLVTLILFSVASTVIDRLALLMSSIVVSASLFILGSGLIGWGLGYGLTHSDRAVLTIESCVRNIAVALLIGGSLLTIEKFGIFAIFLTGYFAVEIIVMLLYARLLSRKFNRNIAGARR